MNYDLVFIIDLIKSFDNFSNYLRLMNSSQVFFDFNSIAIFISNHRHQQHNMALYYTYTDSSKANMSLWYAYKFFFLSKLN